MIKIKKIKKVIKIIKIGRAEYPLFSRSSDASCKKLIKIVS